MAEKYATSWRDSEADKILLREKQRQLAHLLGMTRTGVDAGPGLPRVPREADIPMTQPAGPATGMPGGPRVPGRKVPTMAEALARAVAWSKSR